MDPPRYAAMVFSATYPRSRAPATAARTGRLAVQVLCEGAYGALVGHTRRHVRPLAWVGALREQAAELIQRAARRAEDPVRVMVDVPEAAQYFAK